jgi:hypothetical protein
MSPERNKPEPREANADEDEQRGELPQQFVHVSARVRRKKFDVHHAEEKLSIKNPELVFSHAV